MTEPQAFVAKILRLQKLGGVAYVGTARKDWVTGDWHDWVNKWPGATMPDEPDLYFCPVLFSKRGRKRENALPSRVLYADLDAVDPRTLEERHGVRPTLAWETSPGRYQCLWVLDAPLPVDKFEQLNQKMTYLVGADKGGWSSTKVLRIPGSVSTKYGRSRGKKFTVRLVGGRGPQYTAAQIRRLTRDVKIGPALRLSDVFGDVGVLPNRRDVLAEWRKRLPERAKRLLAAKHVPLGSDRSAKLWELYNVLLQAGMTPPQVLVVVQSTVWNKYHGQPREVSQLQREIAKAAEKHAQPDELERMKRPRINGKKPRGATGRKVAKRHAAQGKGMLPYLTLDEFMGMDFPAPQWLVEGVWELGAYGIWAGVYKGYKTTTLIDLILSVSSGKPFLGQFKVHNPGRVLYIHEEGRQGQLQDRIHRIGTKKEQTAKIHPAVKAKDTVLEAPHWPEVDIVSFTGFKLSDSESQRRLVTYLSQRPTRLVILESWYLMAGDVNENHASEVEPVLEWLGRIARDFGTGIIISHHYNKGSDDDGHKRRAPDRVSGSGVFGRWWESAVFIDRKGEEEDYKAAFEAHHRGQKGTGKLELQFEMDTEDEDHYEVTFVDTAASDVKPKDPADHELVLGRTRTTRKQA